MGQPDQGEPLLRELADFWKQKAGADSPQYASKLTALGRNLLRQRRFTDAEPVLRDSLAIGEQKQPDNWATWMALARASSGAERRDACARAREANPRLTRCP